MSYYNSIASGYGELHGEEQRKKLKIISEYVSVKKTDKLLDVGAGLGFVSEFFDCNITAIDPSVELLGKNPAMEKVVGRAEELPFADHSFDIILCLSVIHHCDLEKAISEMKRVGKELFIISVLKKANNYQEIVDLLKKNFKVQEELSDKKDSIFILN